MKVLVIEDDEKIASFIAKGLKESGFVVDVAYDGLTAESMASQESYDCIVSDIMLPGKDGLSVVKSLRGQQIVTPVIFLSAKTSVDDRIAGLNVGGDDYLGKPFAISELTARVQALIRRSGPVVPQSTQLTVGDLTVNLLTREVSRAGKRLELQAREFSLLEFLIRNQGHCVTKTQILGHVWDYNFDPQTNVVDVLVCRLRNKVDKGFKDSLIRTMRGMGYQIQAPENTTKRGSSKNGV